MTTKQMLSLSVAVFLLLISGVGPDLYGLSISSTASSFDPTSEKNASLVSIRLSTNHRNVSPREIQSILSNTEIKVYTQAPIAGGGYYQSSNYSNRYSSFFDNAESFLIELVEFFLFLALISYAVGYEEWLPWEKDKK